MISKSTRLFALALTLLLAFGAAHAKVPDGWPFVGFNEAVSTAKRLNKPLFVLMRRSSRTKVDAFMKYDLYVSSGAYKRTSFEDYLIERGPREEKVE